MGIDGRFDEFELARVEASVQEGLAQQKAAVGDQAGPIATEGALPDFGPNGQPEPELVDPRTVRPTSTPNAG